MSRWVIWSVHAVGMVICVTLLDVSALSAIQSSLGAGIVLLLHAIWDKD